eukprot:12791845-Alexandrium_andersonii.AAC.1
MSTHCELNLEDDSRLRPEPSKPIVTSRRTAVRSSALPGSRGVFCFRRRLANQTFQQLGLVQKYGAQANPGMWPRPLGAW